MRGGQAVITMKPATWSQPNGYHIQVLDIQMKVHLDILQIHYQLELTNRVLPLPRLYNQQAFTVRSEKNLTITYKIVHCKCKEVVCTRNLENLVHELCLATTVKPTILQLSNFCRQYGGRIVGDTLKVKVH